MPRSSSFIVELGDKDEVDKEEDSIGPPNSMSSEFLFDVKLLDGDGRFLRGIVDGTCLISIVIAVIQNYNACHNNFQNDVSHDSN